MPASALDRFLQLLRDSVAAGSLRKLTLGKPRGADPTLQNLFIRPVILRGEPRLSFVYRHATRDVTKNHPPAMALSLITVLLGRDFLDAHLFTATQTAQLECQPGGAARLRVKNTPAKNADPAADAPAAAVHDRARERLIPADAPWLRALGVTNDRGQPREGMAGKFRQIQKFAELLTPLLADAFPAPARRAAEDGSSPAAPHPPLHVADMGCGKGYLTFAVAALFGDRVRVRGIERRAELVELGNRVAGECGLTNLAFSVGEIGAAATGPLDVLIALHACDTATDDALAHGVAAGAGLLVVSPCCQKEIRPQLVAPPVLAAAFRHGILLERQAEFVTDALRAQLLDWAGYETKVFEFISTEHTAKNLLITGVKRAATPDREPVAARLRAFAAFYGIRRQQLATNLGFTLSP